MTDTAQAIFWIICAIWYAAVLSVVPPAPNPPPEGSRFALAHKYVWGKRLWITMAGITVFGLMWAILSPIVERLAAA